MDVITGSGVIPVLTQPECAIGAHVTWFEEQRLQRCSNCGSSLFRLYSVNTDEGTFDHEICAVCNCRLGGRPNNFKTILQYFNGDMEHPFECIPIKQRDIDEFVYNTELKESPTEQFIEYLGSINYNVITHTIAKINKVLEI
jgi:hypothetical protein